ncbi:hypothetical protein [Anaeromyxobacter terrae]|uniref:hypothetical protein n=1 Tax=Anaeromyxobacter terrae TaxID=2925406 RepID=UPI001F5617D5|nr:hypothetical protein [Anaeromyxobacter sp. SG22]
MEDGNGVRMVHGYDPVQRRVLCGVSQQVSSTKHASGVTCPTCRELLRVARSAPAGAHDARDL